MGTHTTVSGGAATSRSAVTPDDDADLPGGTAVLAATGSGVAMVIAANDADDDAGTIYLAAGAVFPLLVRRVLATGTTATGISALR